MGVWEVFRNNLEEDLRYVWKQRKEFPKITAGVAAGLIGLTSLGILGSIGVIASAALPYVPVAVFVVGLLTILGRAAYKTYYDPRLQKEAKAELNPNATDGNANDPAHLAERIALLEKALNTFVQSPNHGITPPIPNRENNRRPGPLRPERPKIAFSYEVQAKAIVDAFNKNNGIFTPEMINKIPSLDIEIQKIGNTLSSSRAHQLSGFIKTDWHNMMEDFNKMRSIQNRGLDKSTPPPIPDRASKPQLPDV